MLLKRKFSCIVQGKNNFSLAYFIQNHIRQLKTIQFIKCVVILLLLTKSIYLSTHLSKSMDLLLSQPRLCEIIH